jgi:hypothetical protein
MTGQRRPETRTANGASGLRGRAGRLPTRPRSYGTVAAGVLFLVMSGLLSVVVFNQVGDTDSVLAVRDQVAQGQTIEREDLVSKQVAGVDDAVAVEDTDAVVGKTAAVDLLAGQVVTTSAVTDDPVPGSGRALVGLALKPSQMPGAGLEAGDLVRVMAVPAGDGSAPPDVEAEVLSSSAQVYSVTGGGSAEGAVKVVTVIASDGEAGRLATYGAAGRVAVVAIADPGGR